MRRPAMDRSYFEALYAGDDDPWKFATSDYEARKYAATLSALPRPRYARALEIGCSIGVLTRALSARCDSLLATEPVARALDQARVRCADRDNVTFARMEAPGEWPRGRFDLILLSEVVYYLTRAQIAALTNRIDESLAEDGQVELVHWVRETDYPLSGDDAVETFLSNSTAFLRVIRQERTPDYRLDLCERCRPSACDNARS